MAKKKKIEETPLMKQYLSIKAKYPDAILLFRVGDFYETFGPDAVLTSQILGIVLTSRANGSSAIELAGFPHHSVDTYLPKLVKSGHRVAICEQLEDPKKTKKIVKRGVTELVSPGTSVSDKIIDHKENNYLACIHFAKETLGVAFIDLSTGSFLITEGDANYIQNIINSFAPSELIYSKKHQEDFKRYINVNTYSFLLEDWLFSYDYASEKLLQHFNTKSLKGFGVEKMSYAIVAAGVALHYLSENKQDQLQHINSLSRIEKDKYVWLDRFSIHNLELLHSAQPDGTALIDIIDHCSTPMGSRLLKNWLVLPLKEEKRINDRLEYVDLFYKDVELTENLQKHLKQVGDLERLISKAALKKINPREVRFIYSSLIQIQLIQKLCAEHSSKKLHTLSEKLNPCDSLQEHINTTLVEEPAVNIAKGGVVKNQVSEELDELRSIKSSGKEFLLNIKERETKKTGISSLKIGFNNVFGYYLEVTNAHKDKVPPEWNRKQTLVNAERYITEELKEYEEKILNAEEKILELEQQIYENLLTELLGYVKIIQQNAQILGFLDCLVGFSVLAHKNNYFRPVVDNSYILEIQEGRHPVIEKRLPVGEEYIPNDVYLNNENQQIIILTGPNMSGKSAILRQTALIAILAQIGSFVPARAARIGIVDKIFTRVGATDNLSVGESTFMVEMLETASILNNISSRSLILLDEIGRGTSTYDGVSIAWAITEFLHQNTLKPKTIFATHYHELNEIASTHKRVKNFNVSVKEYKNKIIFLRKLTPGGSEHSFGIHVAEMAGVPSKIVSRAKLILEELEKQRSSIEEGGAPSNSQGNIQLQLFDITDPVYELVKKEIDKIDINSLTPIEALMKLNHLKSLIKKEL